MRIPNVLYTEDGGSRSPLDRTTERALAINEAVRPHVEETLDEQRRTMRVAGAVGAITLVVGLVVVTATVLVGLGIALLGVLIGGIGYKYATTKTPDVTVQRVERSHWTGYTVPTDDGVVLYDGSDALPAEEFELERVAQRETVEATRERLNEFDELPAVMREPEEIEREVQETLDELRASLDETERYTVEAPVLDPSDAPTETIVALSDHATETVVETEPPVSPAEAEEDVAQLAELDRMADADTDGTVEAVATDSTELFESLSETQVASIERLNDHIQTVADASGMVSYNFYCPDCLSDEIESRVTPVDGETPWQCDTCRGRFETTGLVPRHQLKDDIVNPIWDQLWREKDDERRRIYDNIEDQKSELQEREFERRREEIQSTTDRIKELRSRIRDLQTQKDASEGVIDEMGELMVKYDRLKQERLDEFQAEIAETFAEIDEKTQQIIEETRAESQERLEAAEQAAQEKAELMREEERKRQLEAVALQERLAAERDARNRAHAEATASQVVAHEAKHSQREMAQERTHHKEEVVNESYDNLSALDTINTWRYWKRRLPVVGGGN